MNHSVTVIIPVYNAEKWVSEAINSAIYQDIKDIEIIVIDDGSTDQSDQIISSYNDDRIIYIKQKNSGPSSARNAGLSISRGKYIKFLDADDFLLPGCLSSQIKHINDRNNTISYGRMLTYDENTGIILPHSKRDCQLDNADSIDNILLVPPVTGSLLYPRDLLMGVGGFDTERKLMDDFDLLSRCILSGAVISSCKEPTYIYRNYISEHRVSKRSSRSDYFSLVKMFLNLKELYLEHKYNYDSKLVAEGIAKTAWIRARTAIAHGYETEATNLFKISRSLSNNCAVGRTPYIVASSLIGPKYAEYTMEFFKKIYRKK